MKCIDGDFSDFAGMEALFPVNHIVVKEGVAQKEPWTYITTLGSSVNRFLMLPYLVGCLLLCCSAARAQRLGGQAATQFMI